MPVRRLCGGYRSRLYARHTSSRAARPPPCRDTKLNFGGASRVAGQSGRLQSDSQFHKLFFECSGPFRSPPSRYGDIQRREFLDLFADFQASGKLLVREWLGRSGADFRNDAPWPGLRKNASTSP